MDPLIYFGGVGMLLLLSVIGMVVALLRGQRRAPRQRTTPSATPSSRVGVVQAEDGAPLLWVVAGQPFESLDAIAEPEQRARAARFQQALREALGAPVAPLHDPSTLPPVEQEGGQEEGREPELPVAAPASPAADVPTGDEDASTFPNPPPLPDRPRRYEEEMERPFLERVWSSFFGTRYDDVPNVLPSAPPPSLVPGSGTPVEELDLLLQRRLMAIHEELPPAHILPRADGLLEITLGRERYERIDDVPDEAVRAAMHEAVQEWLRSGGSL